MNARILNRDFKHPADGWYMIEPKGEHLNHRSGIVQVIDDEACETIVNRFNADAAAGKLSHGQEMLIDHEHFKHDENQETRAYGWLQQLQNRADGIYGQPRWTDTGRQSVDGGDYRFFSTEYDPADLKVLNRSNPKRVRPIRLDGLSLTNNPNNRGGRPITNRRTPGTASLPEFRRGLEAEAGNENQNQRTMMKSVATKLGLSAEASEEAILAEVTKVQNRATDAEGKVTPLTQRVTTLETENGQLLGEQVDALMDAHGIKADDKVRNRLKPVLAGLKNREDRVACLGEFGFKAGTDAGAPRQTKLFNRDTKAPNQGREAGAADGQAEKAKANKIMNRAAELTKQHPNLSMATAVGMAQGELENAS